MHQYEKSKTILKRTEKFGLVSLFNGISTFVGYLMPKLFSLKNYLTHYWEDKGVHTFPKGICPKVNVIARLEYELAYYDSVVHRFNHYTTRTPAKDREGLITAANNSNYNIRTDKAKNKM